MKLQPEQIGFFPLYTPDYGTGFQPRWYNRVTGEITQEPPVIIPLTYTDREELVTYNRETGELHKGARSMGRLKPHPQILLNLLLENMNVGVPRKELYQAIHPESPQIKVDDPVWFERRYRQTVMHQIRQLRLKLEGLYGPLKYKIDTQTHLGYRWVDHSPLCGPIGKTY